jgi:6-pyruvoyltetrahydropterin/6-carboxytetrahydropterin synthase
MTRPFQVSLRKEQLTFSAAHFITYNGDVCESLHGHNFGVRCEVSGGLTGDRYVIDFIVLRDELAKIVAELDHRVLLPQHHALIRVAAGEREVTAQFRDRRWIFPAADCRILPVENTTAEEIAQYIGDRLLEALARRLGSLANVRRIVVGVDENQGQWGSCEVYRHSDGGDDFSE